MPYLGNVPASFNVGTNNIDNGAVTSAKLSSDLNIDLDLGSASTPSLTFDANTGIYSPGADQVAISTNGTGRLFVDSSGRVGVGAASPSDLIHVAGAYGAGTVRFEDTANTNSIGKVFGYAGGLYLQSRNNTNYGEIVFRGENSGGTTEYMRLDSSGRLGLGTSSPEQLLDVQGITNPSIQVKSTGTASTDNARLRIAIGGTTATSEIYFADSAASAIGAIQYRHSDNRLSFTTNNDVRAVIDSSGRLGVGTTSPSQLLEINGASTPSVQIKDTTNNVIARIGADDNTALVGTRSNHPTVFQINDAEVARLDASGRLLVGTSTHSGLNTSGYTGLNAYFANTGDTGISLARFQNTTNSPSLQFLKSRGTSVGSYTVVSSGDDLGEVVFSGADGDEFRAGASITAQVDGTPGNNDMPGRLVFSTTADGASSPTERLRIANNGAWGLAGANYGTSGQVLTSQGSGAAPQWASASTGNDFNFASGTLSGTDIIVYSLPAAAMKIVIGLRFVLWSSGSTSFYLRLGNGSGIISTGYDSISGFFGGGQGATSYNQWFMLNQGFGGTNVREYGTIELNKKNSTEWHMSFAGLTTSDPNYILSANGALSHSGTIDRLQLAVNTGTFGGGTYGVNVFTE